MRIRSTACRAQSNGDDWSLSLLYADLSGRKAAGLSCRFAAFGPVLLPPSGDPDRVRFFAIVDDQIVLYTADLAPHPVLTVPGAAQMLYNANPVLDNNGIQYCVIGGQAVNAYVEPLVSLDLDLAVAADQLERVEKLLGEQFSLKRFAHSLDVSTPGSDLRVQVQTDPRYAEFVPRAARRSVLGLVVPVARLEDVLSGKIWAAQDVKRRGQVPQEILARLI